MSQIGIAIAIFICTVILFASEKLPAAFVALLAMLAMYFSGIATAAQALSGFSNSGTLLVLAMMMIGGAFVQCGLADWVCNQILLFSGKNEKHSALLVCLCGSMLSFVINPTAVLTMLLPVIATLEKRSEKKLPQRTVILPLAISCSYSALLNAVSTSSMVVCSGLLEESSFKRGINYLEPFSIGVAALILFYIFYHTIGFRLLHSWFANGRCAESIAHVQMVQREAYHLQKKNACIVLGVLGLCICGFLFTDFNIAMIALACVALLILSGCLSMRQAVDSVNWNTILVIACCIGFAKGFEVSGAAEWIAEGILLRLGTLGQNPYVLCCLVLILSTILSNFMSNTATAVTMIPIAFALASGIGAPMLPFALSVGIGVNLSVSTPICSPPFTLTMGYGYVFKDYVIFGGCANLLGVVGCCIMLKLLYFI